jgi:hypothetical protein
VITWTGSIAWPTRSTSDAGRCTSPGKSVLTGMGLSLAAMGIAAAGGLPPGRRGVVPRADRSRRDPQRRCGRCAMDQGLADRPGERDGQDATAGATSGECGSRTRLTRGQGRGRERGMGRVGGRHRAVPLASVSMGPSSTAARRYSAASPGRSSPQRSRPDHGLDDHPARRTSRSPDHLLAGDV